MKQPPPNIKGGGVFGLEPHGGEPAGLGVPLLGGWVGLDHRKGITLQFQRVRPTAAKDTLNHQPAEAGLWYQSERRAKAVKKKPGRLL